MTTFTDKEDIVIKAKFKSGKNVTISIWDNGNSKWILTSSRCKKELNDVYSFNVGKHAIKLPVGNYICYVTDGYFTREKRIEVINV